MKRTMFSLLLIGMMSQTVQSLAGPVRPRSAKAQQAAQARLSAGKPVPPPLNDRPRN